MEVAVKCPKIAGINTVRVHKMSVDISLQFIPALTKDLLLDAVSGCGLAYLMHLPA